MEILTGVKVAVNIYFMFVMNRGRLLQSSRGPLEAQGNTHKANMFSECNFVISEKHLIAEQSNF